MRRSAPPALAFAFAVAFGAGVALAGITSGGAGGGVNGGIYGAGGDAASGLGYIIKFGGDADTNTEDAVVGGVQNEPPAASAAESNAEVPAAGAIATLAHHGSAAPTNPNYDVVVAGVVEDTITPGTSQSAAIDVAIDVSVGDSLRIEYDGTGTPALLGVVWQVYIQDDGGSDETGCVLQWGADLDGGSGSGLRMQANGDADDADIVSTDARRKLVSPVTGVASRFSWRTTSAVDADTTLELLEDGVSIETFDLEDDTLGFAAFADAITKGSEYEIEITAGAAPNETIVCLYLVAD
jgi:hypothetical protein